MTLPENAPARKPRRLWLYAPFVLLLAVTAAWIVGWGRMRDAVFRHMDDYARAAGENGYRIDWKSRSLSGFPFRLDLDVAAPRVTEASGWGLSAPRLKAEAFVFAADHWIIVAPDGVTLQRRVGGPVAVAAKVLRASLSDAGGHPPRVSVEGLGLTFTAPPGAAPAPMTRASELHLHSKAGPSDQGAFYVEVDDATIAADSALATLAGPGPATFKADAIVSHAGALTGAGLAGALRGWSRAGGGLTVRTLSLQAAGKGVETRGGELSLDGGGRLKGRLDLTARPGTRLLAYVARVGAPGAAALTAAQAVMAAAASGDRTDVTVDFEAGQTTLGPVGVGPAPRLY